MDDSAKAIEDFHNWYRGLLASTQTCYRRPFQPDKLPLPHDMVSPKDTVRVFLQLFPDNVSHQDALLESAEVAYPCGFPMEKVKWAAMKAEMTT